MKKNIDLKVDTCQPAPDIEHIEIIDIDGNKLAIEYKVSIHDTDMENGLVNLVIGIDEMFISRVH